MDSKQTSAGYIIANNNAILGFGRTEVAAVADARRWSGEDLKLPELRRGYGAGCLYIMPATQRLLDKVSADGGAITWNERGPVADIEE